MFVCAFTYLCMYEERVDSENTRFYRYVQKHMQCKVHLRQDLMTIWQ